MLCLLVGASMGLHAMEHSRDGGNNGDKKSYWNSVNNYALSAAVLNPVFQVSGYASSYMHVVQPAFSLVAKTPVIGAFMGGVGLKVAPYATTLLTTGWGVPLFSGVLCAKPLVDVYKHRNLWPTLSASLSNNGIKKWQYALETVGAAALLAGLGALAAHCKGTPVVGA